MTQVPVDTPIEASACLPNARMPPGVDYPFRTLVFDLEIALVDGLTQNGRRIEPGLAVWSVPLSEATVVELSANQVPGAAMQVLLAKTCATWPGMRPRTSLAPCPNLGLLRGATQGPVSRS